jgi:cytochrome c-type biogenesis protein CcmF
MAVPIGVAILFLMGIGPALPWGRPSGAKVRDALLVPAAIGVVVAIVGTALGVTSPWPTVTLFCAGLTATVTVRELRSAWTAANLRRLGGYVIHAGIVVLIVSVSISSSYRVDREVILDKGACVDFGGHSLCYTGTRDVKEPHRTLQVADVQVDGTEALEPALAIYARMGNPIGSPAVLSSPSHDLYVSLMNLQDGGAQAGFHLFKNPMVPWIWVGGGICALGTLMSLWPSRKRAAAAVEAT